jgi:hypothetical protein
MAPALSIEFLPTLSGFVLIACPDAALPVHNESGRHRPRRSDDVAHDRLITISLQRYLRARLYVVLVVNCVKLLGR